MNRTKGMRFLALGVSLGLAMLAASPSVLADTWQITVLNDTGAPADNIEMTLGGTGGLITVPVAVNPVPANFTAPPPGNELDSNWFAIAPFVLPGQSFVADFDLPAGLTPSLIVGTWSINATPFAPVNPAVTTLADLGVPEPSSMVLACFAAAGLAVTAIRRRHHNR